MHVRASYPSYGKGHSPASRRDYCLFQPCVPACWFAQPGHSLASPAAPRTPPPPCPAPHPAPAGLAWVGKGTKLQLLPVLNSTYSEAGDSYEAEYSFACMTASRDLISKAGWAP